MLQEKSNLQNEREEMLKEFNSRVEKRARDLYEDYIHSNKQELIEVNQNNSIECLLVF